jgi:hypothetical protein
MPLRGEKIFSLKVGASVRHIQNFIFKKGGRSSFSVMKFFSINIMNLRNFGVSERSLQIEVYEKVKVYDKMPHFMKFLGANEQALNQ